MNMDIEVREAVTKRFVSDELRKMFVEMDQVKILFLFTMIDNHLRRDEDPSEFVAGLKSIL